MASYQDCFKKKATEAAKFVGRVGEEHRLFCCSADLISQSGDEPWKVPSAPEEKVCDAMLEFMQGCRGVGDVTACFDGCMRNSRRKLEDNLFSHIGHYSELFVVYSGSWNEHFKKKVFFGSDNCEVGYIALPVSRSRLELKERDEGFSASGDSTSYFRSLSGVGVSPRLSLPRISSEDKKKIFSTNPDVLPKKWRDAVTSGEPLYWQETKSKGFWIQILRELTAKCVVDATPGSGTLAVACMELGVQYFGMCRDATHCSWLGNVLDRAALTYVCEAGAHLYQEDLAGTIKELFADMLQNTEEELSDEILAASEDED